MKVSVIIPAYNEETVIENCIKSLLKQDYQNFEILVIDDGSNDKTVSIVENLLEGNKRLHLLRQNHEGAGQARNHGAQKATGEIFVFVDSDMTFSTDFISNLVDPIVNKRALGTFSSDEFVSNWDSSYAKFWNWNQGIFTNARHATRHQKTQKVFRAILASEFNKVGGFSEGGHTDDWNLSEKLGYEAVRAPKAVFYHENPSSLKEVFTHATWVGKRKYKYGIVGILYALLRVSIPISIVNGVVFSIARGNYKYLLFKIIYDLGITLGILKYTLTGRGMK